jgi:hypothetical protein
VPLRVVLQLPHPLEQPAPPDPAGELGEPTLGGAQRGELRPEVAKRRRRLAHVRLDQAPHVLDGLPRAHPANRRQEQPFLEDRAVVGTLGAGVPAADVDVMGAGAPPGHKLAVEIQRREHEDVRRVRGAPVGVVNEERVSGPPCVGGVRPLDPTHDPGHRPELRGDVVGLGDHAALGVEQGTGEVEHLPDHR